MIPILQAISQVAVPVVAEPINVGGNGGGMDFTTYSLIIAVVAVGAIAFMAFSKVSALIMYKERAEERRQDDQIAALRREVDEREHWLQHQVDNRQPFPGRGAT